MLGIISSVISGLGSGFLAPILGYFTTARNDDLAGFQSGALTDTTRYTAYLNATVQMAQIQASMNVWWGARLIILVLAGSVAIHFSAIMLDSTPFLWHQVGSWAIPKPPAPYDDYEGKIVLSFFIMAPIAPIASAVTAWFHRK
jgi:hypothetical protein